MKKINKYFSCVVSVLLAALAAIFGGAIVMAMADNTGAIADDKGLNTDLTGTVASGTQIREGELAEPEVDEYIAKFRPYRFPLDTDVRTQMRKCTVKGYEVEHYQSGSARLETKLQTAITNNSDKAETVNLTPTTGTIRMIPKYATIEVPGVSGYAEDGTTESGSLMLFVTAKTEGNAYVTVMALNGPIYDGSMYVPNIPANSDLIICANMCSESQMQVAPENYQPRPRLVYLQKKIVNIVMTDHFKEIIKKVPFFEDDLRDNALYNFRRKNARSLWVGVKKKLKMDVGNNMGEEFFYSSEGILRQVTMSYTTVDDQIKFEDLIALAKMQHTAYSASDESNVYCGKDFMSNLLNIDFTKHKDIEFTSATDMGIDIRSFKCTFGKLNFKYDPTLDDIGYKNKAVVLDVKNAVRYIKVDDKAQTVDMKKGAGETREASRDIHTQIDAVALRGYNSIIVNIGEDSDAKTVFQPLILAVSSATLPTTNLTNGMLVYLTAAVDDGTYDFAAGTIVVYNTSTTSWSEYTGGDTI